MTSRLSMIFAALCFAACGSGKSAPAASPASPTEHAEHGEHAEHAAQGEHENMPPELVKFHDVLAPRWHADKGSKRMADTCNAIDEFRADADAVAKATPPRGANADAWTAGTKRLVAAVAALGENCKKENQAPGFDAKFEEVHKAFHGLLEAAGEGHGEGEHHEGMEGMHHGEGEHHEHEH